MQTLIEKVDITKLLENEVNPRYIDEEKKEALKKSIKDFPDMLEKRPLIVNSNYVVIGGNMRLKACKELGYNEISVIKVDWTEEKQKEFIIKDNVSFGFWDLDLLQDEFEIEDLENWGLDDIFEGIEDVNEDIQEVDNFNESVKFTIQCEDIEQLEKLQSKLGTEAEKINYQTFLDLTGL